MEEEQELYTKPHAKNKNSKRKKIHATIDVISQQPDKVEPLVGYFPSGFNPVPGPDDEFYEEGAQPPKVKVFRNEKRPNRIQLVVSPTESSRVHYVGTNYSGEAATRQACTYALGVLDKETNTLKIVPIAANKIFRLEAKIEGVDSVDNDQLNPVAREEVTAEERASKNRELTERYGTKRSLVQAKKRDLLKHHEDATTKEDLDKKIKEVVINKEALDTTTASTARNIPPYDLSATTPEQAYPLDKIIFSGEWDFLHDILDHFHGESEVDPDSYPTFVRNRIEKLREIKVEAQLKQLGCILSYITHLIKFKDQHSMDGVSSAKSHKIPNILRSKFYTLFADSASKRLPDEKCALLISHVLVLTLFVDQFKTNPIDIAKDLRMNALTLRMHFEQLGCKLKQDKKVLYATLPVPLQFQAMRQRRKKR